MCYHKLCIAYLSNPIIRYIKLWWCCPLSVHFLSTMSTFTFIFHVLSHVSHYAVLLLSTTSTFTVFSFPFVKLSISPCLAGLFLGAGESGMLAQQVDSLVCMHWSQTQTGEYIQHIWGIWKYAIDSYRLLYQSLHIGLHWLSHYVPQGIYAAPPPP